MRHRREEAYFSSFIEESRRYGTAYIKQYLYVSYVSYNVDVFLT